MKRLSFLSAVLLAVGVLNAADPVEKRTPEGVEDLLTLQKKVLEIRDEVRAATVAVKMGRGAGSGVIVSKDGLVLTAGHVSGKPGQKFQVILSDGRTFEGVALGNSPKTDSGMIQIKKPKDLPIVDFVGPSQPDIGQWVVAVGNMGGWDAKRGAVFRLGRVIAVSRDTIRTDCKLLGGDSGGPLFDLSGRVIGIHSRISSAPDQNYHVAMIAFHDDWKDLKDGKSVKPIGEGERGYLGVNFSTDPKGARVTRVGEDTVAEKAGLKPGDIITHFDGHKLFAGGDLRALIEKTKAGDEVILSVEREGKSMDIDLKLGKRP
ncbi:MAG: hypothetical protein CMO74_13300 [Verrucomicrobiales bacterium]|nr:hypothetical protein [Verrucomicrobiales bacterium]